MEGEAILVSNREETKEIMEMLKQKFPFMVDLTKDPDSIIIKISPKLCHFIDYTKGFGFRDKIKY